MTDATSEDQPDDALGPLRTHLTATVDALEAGRRAPTVLLLAFEGWNDAGDAASGALDALREHLTTRGHTQLRQDRGHVMVRGFRRDVQPLGDLRIR